MKLLVCNCFYLVTSSVLGPNILFSTLLSNALNLCSSIRVKYEIPHSCKKADRPKIIVLQSLTVIFNESKSDN